tara:strand:+ start:313 stop:954 length:642 start_codon:yes stop_codon:yes gene_type:complete
MLYIILKKLYLTHIKLIKFINIDKKEPFSLLHEYYLEAVRLKQKSPEIFIVSSYDEAIKEVDSRCVNLKIVDENKFIFFSNYLSPKSKQFKNHPTVSTIIFWDALNLQIRMKGTIERTSDSFNQDYFAERSKAKNALAISSNQSSKIESYQDVVNKYQDTLKNKDLLKCPSYWGGFMFLPYNIEFWKGHKNRLNKRDLYQLENNIWLKSILEP